MSKTQWYIGAPNAVILCVDVFHPERLQGRMYHSYSASPGIFQSTEQMTFQMEELYEKLQFPHASTNERSFKDEKKPYHQAEERVQIMSDQELLSKHGDLGTFIVRVQHRQNSSWQGRITWMEQDKTINFRSVWEMIKLIESAVDTVSEEEEDEETPNWPKD